MTTSPPRVSAITIFFDAEPYLGEAIASILDQTFADLELILVDDGSTDGSVEVARAAAAAYPDRIRCVAHPDGANHGMSRSRNLGLSLARGEYVAFLDADDVWLPDAVEFQVAHLERQPRAAMSIGATTYWRSWSSAGASDDLHVVGVKGLVEPPELAARLLTQRIGPPSVNAAMSRRAAVAEMGGFRDEFRSLYEDQAFFFAFFLVHPVVVHDEVVDRYRQHDRSAVATGLATGAYHPLAPSPARLTHRRFVVQHLVEQGWRGTPLHREAVWLARRDRFPRTGHLLYKLRPGLRARIASRMRRTPGT